MKEEITKCYAVGYYGYHDWKVQIRDMNVLKSGFVTHFGELIEEVNKSNYLKEQKEWIKLSILQDYEQIKNRIGKEKFKAIEEYLELNPNLYLSDIYYKETEWNKFEEWYNKRKEMWLLW